MKYKTTKNVAALKFGRTEQRAVRQHCHLERRRRGDNRFVLYSNRTFTEGDFKNLDEVIEALDSDPSFK